MAITVTKLAAPTNLVGTPQTGGNLAASTQYWFVVIAYDQAYISPTNNTRHTLHSDISAEGTFTTDVTNRSVLITWDNASGATRYNVLITTVSGDYSGCGGYGGILGENIGTITDGVAGLTVTDISTSLYVFHGIQLSSEMDVDTNNLIPNTLGNVHVNLDGTGTIDLQDIYDACVGQGFGAYCYYDGFTFKLKGYIIVESSVSDAGSLVVEQKRLIFFKGGVHNLSADYVIRFGRWSGDVYQKSYYPMTCSIDIQNSRYPFSCNYDGAILMYGCTISPGHSWGSDPMDEGYFNGGQQIYLSGVVSEYIENILAMNSRAVTSDVYDTKWYQGNNWGNYNHVRLLTLGSANLPYYGVPNPGGKFYDTIWNSGFIRMHEFNNPGAFPQNFTNFYDCQFPTKTNGMVQTNDCSWSNLQSPDYWSDTYTQFNYSLDMQVLDVDGNPMEGVTISAVDKDDNPAVWIEQDDSFDRLVTEVTYTTDRTTDSNGEVFYYLKSYTHTLDPAANTTAWTGSIKNDFYPYTFTFSKTGYRDYSIIIDDMNDSVKGIVTLEQQELSPLKFGTLKIT